jgi:curved DNA-binding protein CbpA
MMTYGRSGWKEVMVMAAAENSGPIPDLYQVLGVSGEASGGEITRAWRRRALAEHPDRKPRDAAAPARFGALAEAYRVLGDPVRRAVYDQSLIDRDVAMPQGPAAEAPAQRSRHGFVVPVTVRPPGRVAEPPLRAGPVWVDIPPSAQAGSPTAEDEMVRLAALAELAVRHLVGGRGRPW